MNKDTYQYRYIDDDELVDFESSYSKHCPDHLAEDAAQHCHSNGGYYYWEQDEDVDFEVFCNGSSLGIFRVELCSLEFFTAEKT